MTKDDFVDYIKNECIHEAIYEDSEGRSVLVITLLDAYAALNTLLNREWQGLTDEEKQMSYAMFNTMSAIGFVQAIEARLKEKNT